MDVLSAVVRQPIDLSTLPAATPHTIRTLLRRCLERDPKHRLHDIADARLDIADAIASPELNPLQRPGRRSGPVVSGPSPACWRSLR